MIHKLSIAAALALLTSWLTSCQTTTDFGVHAVQPRDISVPRAMVLDTHLYRSNTMQIGDYRHANLERPPAPDIDKDPAAEILATAVAPGDTLVWNSHTFHGAPGNRLDRRRAAFSVNWVGDDVTYTAAPSLETYRDPSLAPGQPIAGARFPMVRQRD